MPRAIWKGSISFGLVHVPVSLYPGEKRDELHLHMLDAKDFSPVGYKRVNKSTGEEVPSDRIVRGYEYEKGEYVVLTNEDLKRANVEATQTVEIVNFVDADKIPLTYYDRPYYLEPQKRGEKAYALLRETLRRTGKIGIAKVVLHTREHLAALVPQGDLLLLDLLRYQDEIRSADELRAPHGDAEELGISDKELQMAQLLVESMVDDWHPEQYRDEYRDDVLKLVEKKLEAGQTHAIEAVPPEAPPRPAEIIDLMSQLKRSVEERQAARGNGDKQPASRMPRTRRAAPATPRTRAPAPEKRPRS
jgi:DNA end-binding protein Ku